MIPVTVVSVSHYRDNVEVRKTKTRKLIIVKAEQLELPEEFKGLEVLYG